jgi:hypothetical protein
MPVDKLTLDDDRVSHREAVLNGQTYRTCSSLDQALNSLINSCRLHTRRPEAWEVQGYRVSHPWVARFVIWLAISDTISHPAKYASRGSRYDGLWENGKWSEMDLLSLATKHLHVRMLHAHRLLICASIPSKELRTTSRSWPNNLGPRGLF